MGQYGDETLTAELKSDSIFSILASFGELLSVTLLPDLGDWYYNKETTVSQLSNSFLFYFPFTSLLTVSLTNYCTPALPFFTFPHLTLLFHYFPIQNSFTCAELFIENR